MLTLRKASNLTSFVEGMKGVSPSYHMDPGYPTLVPYPCDVIPYFTRALQVISDTTVLSMPKQEGAFPC